MNFRWWAFWRRLQYSVGIFLFLSLIFTSVYFIYFQKDATCFDGEMNGIERGVDCGGACTLICGFDVTPPEILWSKSFKIFDGQYNAVAYIENRNFTAGAPKVLYTFSLYDNDGLITERSGETVLPPDSIYPIFEGRIQTGGRVPTRTDLRLEEIDVWVPAEYGRGQFITKNRELKNVDNDPRLEATLENTSVAPARNVEIVATIFDSHKRPLTASRTIVPEFQGGATQEVVFTWPEPIAKTLTSCEVPTDVMLAIDLSGSMNNDGDNPPEPISSVLLAAKAFVSRLEAGDQGGVVSFATNAQVEEVLTSQTDVLERTITQLTILPTEEKGSTNTGDAIKFAREEFRSVRHNFDARKVLVLLTDGLTNAPGETPEEYALSETQLIKNDGVQVFTIGLGDSVNEEFLRSIATSDEEYFFAASVRTIGDIYRSITGAICEEGVAVIDIIPKTETSFSQVR